MAVSAEQVKKLREMSGAPMMECKKALEEAAGDPEKAYTILRKRGQASAAKKAGRVASEGLVGSYVHPGAKLAVIVEVNCESDFVARTDEFQELAHDLAMQICAIRTGARASPGSWICLVQRAAFTRSWNRGSGSIAMTVYGSVPYSTQPTSMKRCSRKPATA